MKKLKLKRKKKNWNVKRTQKREPTRSALLGRPTPVRGCTTLGPRQPGRPIRIGRRAGMRRPRLRGNMSCGPFAPLQLVFGFSRGFLVHLVFVFPLVFFCMFLVLLIFFWFFVLQI
jgi:hypothetical protein